MSKKYEIGKIVNTFGIKGEIKIYPYVDYIMDLKYFYVDDNKMEIEKCRTQKNLVIVKIKGIDDINVVEKLKGKIVSVYEEDLPSLPEGTYYIKDLIGLDVITDDGRELGKLDDVIQTGANDVYDVNGILLPVIDEVVKKIDLKNHKIVVHLIDGLI
jgi:16S rRNA processing protein RimM